MRKDGVLYWITGLSGAGKTTIGNRLYYELKCIQDNVVLLDGDILKNIVGDHLGYSEEDRYKRAVRYAMLCKTLTDQGITVICCTIAMYDEVREWNRKNNKGYVEVFLNVPMDILIERDQKGMYTKYKKGEMENLAGIDVEVEYPKTPDIEIVNDGTLTIKECVDKIMQFSVDFSKDFQRDTDYWNQYYESGNAVQEPSKFAVFVSKYLKASKNILELGCGNGRDSLFFHQSGLNVTAIDASDRVISDLRKKNRDGNICFICDDFVCSSAIFAGQYDYCYSRFSLHAINEMQEEEVIHNVYRILKTGGLFFIEVRSIHDELYGKGEMVGRNAYTYDGHYRRFIVQEELEDRLKKAGFLIIYSEENIDFAPYKDSNPPIIRIIGEKK